MNEGEKKEAESSVVPLDEEESINKQQTTILEQVKLHCINLNTNYLYISGYNYLLFVAIDVFISIRLCVVLRMKRI